MRVGIAVGVALVSGFAFSAPVPQTGVRMDVGANVQVSAANARDTHYEVHAAADPRNPGRIVVGSIVYPESNLTTVTAVYASADDGKSWKSTLGGARLENTGDPALAYGADGSAYYTASHIPAAGDRTMLFFRSRDGGSTWSDSSTLTYSDRQYVTADATGGKYNGRIYVNGNNRVPRDVSDFVVFASADGGKTFQGPAKRNGFGKFSAQSMGNAVVLSNGALVGVFSEARGTRAVLNAMTSSDGGASLNDAVTIGDFVGGGNRKGADNNVNSQPIVAVDATRGKFKDRLYVVWPDRRGGHSQIFFAMSADSGATWSEARAISDNAPSDSTDQLMPAVAVNRAGAVGVMWYDRRNHPDNMGWDVRFTASLDGGASFAPSVAVSTGGTTFGPATPWTGIRPAITRTPAGITLRVSLNSFMFLGGDTAGLVADASGVFHAVWVDNRTGIPQVWTAPVTVSASHGATTAPPPQRVATRDAGSNAKGVPATPLIVKPSVSTSGAELSDKVALVVTRVSYDRAGEVLTLAAHLENRSAGRLSGPLRLRAAAMQAELGDPVALNADNGLAGAGAEWIFAGADLAPNGASAEKVLRFTLSNLREFRAGRQYRLGLLELAAGVYGGSR